MNGIRCPGQDTGFWDFTAIYDVKCPKCEQPVEFFKDEPARICKKCGHEFVNPKMDFGCAAYCKYAEQCLGSLPPELIAEKEELFKDRIAIEVKKSICRDFKRLNRIMKTAGYVEKIIKEEMANPPVIISAAYLYDAGSGKAESISIARQILNKLNAKKEMIEEVCNLIESINQDKKEMTMNHNILHDAILLADVEGKIKEGAINSNELIKNIEQRLITETAKNLVKKLQTIGEKK